MTEPAYPAARGVAGRVEAYFARHLAAARTNGGADFAAAPDAASIEAMLDVAFWASLRREEGFSPRISVAWLSPEQAEWPLLFEWPLPLAPGPLTRLGPAVERPGIHLGVWPRDGALRVWGMTQTVPPFCFVLEVVRPGLLVVKCRRAPAPGKYANVAVLEGDSIKVLRERAPALEGCPQRVTALLGTEPPAVWTGGPNVLVDVALSMRAHGRGGTMLLVPASAPATWRESMVAPIARVMAPPFGQLAALTRQAPDEPAAHAWREAIRAAVEEVAALTAVDGATVMTDGYEVLAFGAKIGRRDGCAPVSDVVVSEPVEGTAPQVVTIAQLGGTRHLSAAQFVHDQRDAAALVASQDGRFTVFAWSPEEDRVHAYRVEARLL